MNGGANPFKSEKWIEGLGGGAEAGVDLVEVGDGSRFAKRHPLQDFREGFDRVYTLMNGCSHPSVVKLLHADGRDQYLEYVESKTFDEIQGELDIPQVLTIFINIASILEGLHESGMAHGDIRNENILVARDKKTVKLIDLSLYGARKQDIQNLLGLIIGWANRNKEKLSKELFESLSHLGWDESIRDVNVDNVTLKGLREELNQLRCKVV